MTLSIEQKKLITVVLGETLEDESFEDFLERFDVTPEDAFLSLYESGVIDPILFEDFLVE